MPSSSDSKGIRHPHSDIDDQHVAVPQVQYDEKAGKRSESVEVADKEAASGSEKTLHAEDFGGTDKDGEPIVTTGRDVSLLIVSLRDEGDSGLTFRSMFLGTVFACLGASICQIYLFKPIQVAVSTYFLLLLIYGIGTGWAAFIPGRTTVEGTRFAFLGPFLHFINPGTFTLKEHVVSTLCASTATAPSGAVLNFAVQRLYYDTRVGALTAVFATFSMALFGYGLVGFLRPLAIYPSDMVYWFNLPTVSVFQGLHFETVPGNKHLRLFWTAFTGMFCYEIIPAYIFPLLNGVNIFCLASQSASQKTLDLFTNLFGGASANEGLGILSLSFDWQYIGSWVMSLPLSTLANTWVGYLFGYMIILSIYYSNAWNSLSFPMLSSSMFAANGSVYRQSALFGPSFQLNETALDQVGLPYLTGSTIWSKIAENLAIGGVITHCIFFWGRYVRESYRIARNGTQDDPHYLAMQKYKEAPWWWYFIILVLSFIAGLVVVLEGETTLPWWSFMVSLAIGTFLTPFSILFAGRTGQSIPASQFMKMIGGVVNPGRPVANLYFSMWSTDVMYAATGLAGDLKMGQYLKIPPRIMFLTQVWGTILGAVFNYIVMVSVVESQREILLKPLGSNVWSGQVIQSLNSSTFTWSLAKQLYGFNGRYWIIPFTLVFGMVLTFVQSLIWKKWTKIGPLKADTVLLPIIYLCSSSVSVGVNSTITSTILVGLISQLWLRRYHPRFYRKYNYILGGALDGGSQMMVFVLSFAVFGASGTQRPFPFWAGHPAKGNVDYCNGNGALGR